MALISQFKCILSDERVLRCQKRSLQNKNKNATWGLKQGIQGSNNKNTDEQERRILSIGGNTL